jgi:hypothetical protein
MHTFLAFVDGGKMLFKILRMLASLECNLLHRHLFTNVICFLTTPVVVADFSGLLGGLR